MIRPPFRLPAGAVLPDFGVGGLYGLAKGVRNWVRGRAGTGFVPEAFDGPLILLVIDGLGDNFLRRHGAGSCLLEHRLRRLTSVFPSTTATALTTLQAGLSPAIHGLTGWHLEDRRMGGVIAPLPMQRRGGGRLHAPFDVERLFSYAGMYVGARMPVSVVSPANIAFSAFSARHGRGAVLLPYVRPDDFVPTVVDALGASASGPAYVHAYYPRFDAVCHRYGAHSVQAVTEFQRVDRYFSRLLDHFAGRGVAVLATADHGFVDAPDRRHLHMSQLPAMAAMLAAPLTGERRSVFCRLRRGAEGDFEAFVRERMAGRAVAVASSQLIDAGLFGPGVRNRHLLAHCGTHALLMEQGWTLSDRIPLERPQRMCGVHGGLSADEMWVPLIAAQP